MTLLSVQDFSLAFLRYEGLLRQKQTLGLRELTFSLERGEMLALVGASGAGKSLLAHALFGILPPNARAEGQILFDGRPLDVGNTVRHRGGRMGLLPQSPSHLDPLVRCGHQLSWAAARSGRKLGRAALAASLARVGLEPEVQRLFPHELSGGMARRLMLAMATIGEPKLVVADEPTSGLDPANAAIVLDHLRQLARAGKGVLLITHDLAQALPFVERVAILRSGRLAGIEPAPAFSGTGGDLGSDYARSLWQAMPENDFATRHDHARSA